MIRTHPDKVESIASFALFSCFIQFFLIYFIAIENQTRSGLLLIVLAAAFYLKGKRQGYTCYIATLTLVLLNHALKIIDTGYSNLDILTLCLYLSAQFFVINAYESHREAQTTRLQALNNTLELQIRERTEQLAAANDALVTEKQNLKLLSDTDHLTGLKNRYSFEERFRQEQLTHGLTKETSALILIDIDFFKRINDKYGHLTGDMVIKVIASHIQSSVRSSDLAARWGGDEFVIYAPRTTLSQGMHLAEKIRQQIAQLSFAMIGSISISAGVAEFMPDDTLETMLQHADLAMYNAKNKGRNLVQGYTLNQ